MVSNGWRKPSVKTLRQIFETRMQCISSGSTQRRVLSGYQSEEMKIVSYPKWKDII